MEFIRDCNLDVANLRGQGYDGAYVMAGKVSGVATQILRQQPKAMYYHCKAHNLNLVVSSTCKQVPEIGNLFDTLRSARLATVSNVIVKHKAIHLALHDISIESSQTEVRNNVMSYYRLMESSTFIVALVVAQFVLSFTHPLCLSLQKVSCDVVKAYHNAKLCKETISKQRSVTKFK